ncbi:MAG TPA: sensor histidine kinase [Bacilli bacterium]
MNIFSRIVILIILLLFPIVVLYGFSNKVSVNVLNNELQISNLNRISFFAGQIDSRTEELSMFPIILVNDPFVRSFLDKPPAEPFQYYSNLSSIRNKLSLQSVSSAWTNILTIYLPRSKQAISSNMFVNYDPLRMQTQLMRNWTYQQVANNGKASYSFVRQFVEPGWAKALSDISAVIEVRFSDENIRAMLRSFREGMVGHLFLFHEGFAPITAENTELTQIAEIIPEVKAALANNRENQVITIGEDKYLFQYVKLQTLDWYLVNVTPLKQILSPITKSRNLFYGSIALLLAMSILAVYLLYRHVQIPIRMLIRNVQKLKRGDFSSRIQYKPKNEFLFLIDQFNDMAEQIQQLIEKVYEEKIRSRDATLKQLQSQINPHFLYNSLFFIINSVELDDKESAVAMAHSLAEYYRYTTRVENQLVPVRDELSMIENYLTIQNLRMERIHYEIHVPERLQAMRIPRLLLQPIVENAVIHGLEKKNAKGLIAISGEIKDDFVQISVEDNGGRMTKEKIQALQAGIAQTKGEEIGCGLWNVQQRLIHQFGEGSGLHFALSPNNGLKVIIRWKKEQ